jgi:large subunit ribosomal protein L22
MEYVATTRNARISPTKVRPSADLIRGKRVEDALNLLGFQARRGSVMLKKTLESAVANAANLGGVDPMDLSVVTVTVDKGIVIKRFRPAPKGRAATRIKKCSHIHVAVAALKAEAK